MKEYAYWKSTACVEIICTEIGVKIKITTEHAVNLIQRVIVILHSNCFRLNI